MYDTILEAWYEEREFVIVGIGLVTLAAIIGPLLMMFLTKKSDWVVIESSGTTEEFLWPTNWPLEWPTSAWLYVLSALLLIIGIGITLRYSLRTRYPKGDKLTMNVASEKDVETVKHRYIVPSRATQIKGTDKAPPPAQDPGTGKTLTDGTIATWKVEYYVAGYRFDASALITELTVILVSFVIWGSALVVPIYATGFVDFEGAASSLMTWIYLVVACVLVAGALYEWSYESKMFDLKAFFGGVVPGMVAAMLILPLWICILIGFSQARMLGGQKKGAQNVAAGESWAGIIIGIFLLAMPLWAPSLYPMTQWMGIEGGPPLWIAAGQWISTSVTALMPAKP